MFIQTYGHGYQVISNVSRHEMGEIYICRDTSTDHECTLLRIKNKDIVPGLMVYLNTYLKESFVDFLTRFVFEGDLCLVLRYYRGRSLADKLRHDYCSLSERMMMGKKILDRIMLLDMPLYFLKNCLLGERIVVEPSLDIFFNYVPDDIADFEQTDDRAVLTAFSNIFIMLFAAELGKRSAPPINKFYDALQKGEQDLDCIELYKQYLEMCREVELIPEEEINRPKSKWFLLWERVKKTFKVFRKMFGVVLLILAVIYLAYTVSDYLHPAVTQVMHFKSIGTLEINSAL